MPDHPGLGKRRSDVDRGGNDDLAHVPGDGRPVFHTVLQADNHRVRSEQRRQLARHRIGVSRLDAEEHQIGT